MFANVPDFPRRDHTVCRLGLPGLSNKHQTGVLDHCAGTFAMRLLRVQPALSERDMAGQGHGHKSG